MNKKNAVCLGVLMALSVTAIICIRAAGVIHNPTPVPDGQYTIDYLVIDVNHGHPIAEFGLVDATSRTNNHAFLTESEFHFQDGHYEKGMQVRVSDSGTTISLTDSQAKP